MPDSTALYAVCPRPQMDASFMANPISSSNATSPLVPPVGLDDQIRCSASSWRTVPTRQGTHWPHDSSRKKAAIRSRIAVEIHRLVEHHDHARAQCRLGRPDALEGQRHVDLVGPDEHARRAAEQDRLKRPARRQPAGHVDHLPQGGAERHLVHTGPLHAAREAEESRSRRSLGADPGVLRAAETEDLEDVDQRLDVVDEGGLPEDAHLHRERRLVARLAAEAFDRVEDRGLLAADVGAPAAPDLDVERESGAHDVGAQQAARARRVDRALQPLGGQRVLSAHVDESLLAAGRERRDRSWPRPR